MALFLTERHDCHAFARLKGRRCPQPRRVCLRNWRRGCAARGARRRAGIPLRRPPDRDAGTARGAVLDGRLRHTRRPHSARHAGARARKRRGCGVTVVARQVALRARAARAPDHSRRILRPFAARRFRATTSRLARPAGLPDSRRCTSSPDRIHCRSKARSSGLEPSPPLAGALRRVAPGRRGAFAARDEAPGTCRHPTGSVGLASRMQQLAAT